MRHIIFFLLTILFCWTTSCKQKDISEIEKIIVDETFITSKISGHDSLRIDTLRQSKFVQTTYYLKDSFTVIVGRDSLNKIRVWWLKDSKGKRVDGAEVYATTGQICGKLNFVNGVMDGETKYYYDDGRVKSKGLFKNGTWWGDWKNYDKDGNFLTYEHYKK